MRYDYINIKETFLKQDFKRPASRHGAGLKLIYTGVNEKYLRGNCEFKSSGYWMRDDNFKDPCPGLKERTVNGSLTGINNCSQVVDASQLPISPWEKSSREPNGTTLDDLRRVPFGDVYEPRVTGIDRRVHWVVPKNCRPQLIMIGGYDVNNYYKSDVWFFDLWNSTWFQVEPIPDPNPYRQPPKPRKFPSINVYSPGFDFTVDKAPSGEYYRDLIYMQGGWAAPPTGAFQDVWAYSREHNKWIDLKPVGRMPSARVFDEIQFIGTTGYLIGGVFGAFKIDVMKYNVVRNRFSLLYAAGAKPSARSYFSTTVYKDSIYVFGGRGWVTVDNEDKQDIWQYNSTENFWYNKEITGVIIPRRWGHSCITFVSTLIVFGGKSSTNGAELGVGDMNEVWRYDLEIGALLADSQYKTNTQGWGAYQNYVEGDYIIPTHCDDYARLIGDYWGMPCKVTYDKAAEQFLWIDSLHNDTDSPPIDHNDRRTGRTVTPSPFLGSNGIGYISAPANFVAVGNKMYQGRLRYQYAKVYPMEDDELRRAFVDTKDDVLLVGEYQVLAFDTLDDLAPRLGRYTLVDVDLDEAKGWYVHGTNGTVKPTKDEFVHVLTTLQMILIRVDYYPSIYRKNVSNYDDLGTVLEVEDAYQNTNDSIKGDSTYDKTQKLGFDGKFYPFGEEDQRIGEYPTWEGKNVWKFTYDLRNLGRTQTHGEIIAIKTVELFENTVPLEQEFLNAKVEGKLICKVSDEFGETCAYKNDTVPAKASPLPENAMNLPSQHSGFGPKQGM